MITSYYYALFLFHLTIVPLVGVVNGYLPSYQVHKEYKQKNYCGSNTHYQKQRTNNQWRFCRITQQPSSSSSSSSSSSIILHRPYRLVSSVRWLEKSSSISSGSSSSNEEGSSIHNTIEGSHHDSDNDEIKTSSSNCPFSKHFPRYRIDFEEEEEEKSSSSLFSVPILSNIQSNLEKSMIEKEYKNDRIEWHYDNKNNDHDHNEINTITSLWRSLDNIVSGGGGGGGGKNKDASSEAVVLAYPNCNRRMIRQFVDIIQWIENEDESQINSSSSNDNNDKDYTIEATFISKWKTPVIRLLLRQKDKNNIDDIDAVASTSTDDNSDNSDEQNYFDPSIIETQTKSWVKRILVEMGICPFTKSVHKSGQGLGDLGVPVGRIAYHTSNASTQQIYKLMADTWEAIGDMISAGPSGKHGVSSILLSAPYYNNNFDLWSGQIFTILEATVVAAGVESEVGVVCFHPQYATPDGTSWPGFGHMHSVPRLRQWLLEFGDPTQEVDKLSIDDVAAGGAWQRRTPHATINVLRSDQLAVAEGRRKTGILYAENICKLVGKQGVGNMKLQEDLKAEQCMEKSS